MYFNTNYQKQSNAAGRSRSPSCHCYHQLASQLANAPIPGGRAGDAACTLPAMQRQWLSSSARNMWTLYTSQSICPQCCVHNVVLDVIRKCSRLDVQNEPPNERVFTSWDTGRATFIEQIENPNELVLSPDTWLQVTSCDPVTSCTTLLEGITNQHPF